MRTSFNLNDINNQIQQYVALIKRQRSAEGTTFSSEESFELPTTNDVRSNIHCLDGKNKFKIQQMLENNTVLTPANYASEAYNYLYNLEEKQKTVIDFMHKNNRNYDVNV